MRIRLALLAGVLVAGAAAVVTSSLAKPAPLATETYTVDQVHSFTLFRIKHANVSYAYGRFNDISGTFTVDQEDPGKVAFDVTVKTASLDTGNKKRDSDVLGPPMFDAEKYPTISFKSTKVEKKGEHNYSVTGDMTLHGTTKPITVDMELVGVADAMGKHRAGYETKFKINRSDYGMGAMLNMLGDEITLVVSLEGTR